MMEDRDFLIRAIHLAEDGITDGSGPFGAVIVRKGEIVSEATNKVVHSNDPTAHAEVLAIRQASKILATHDLSDCTLYTSCEPCPMCLGAIYWAGIRTIFFAADRHDAEAAGFSDKYIYEEISLPPEKRHILFKRLSDVDGTEVFRMWDRFENKIPY